MKRSSMVICLLALVLATCAGARAQGSKTTHYDKDGLAFDYPSGWAIQETSDSNAQVFKFSPPASDLQIGIYVHRGVADTPDKVAAARTKIVDSFIDSQSQQMKEMGMTPARTDGKSTVGGAEADVAHLRGSLDGVDGEAGIYWNMLNNRLVVFSTLGPDQDLKRLSTQIDALRASVTVAAPAAAAPPASKY